MSISKRLRMITFRVSDDEYASLRALYTTAGARSVSELARSAIQYLLAHGVSPGGPAALSDKLEDIDFRLGLLDREVARLSRLIDSARPSPISVRVLDRTARPD